MGTLSIIKKYTLCFFILLFFIGNSNGQSRIDSCLNKLAEYKGNKTHIEFSNLLFETGGTYLETQAYAQAHEYFQQSLLLAEQLEDVSLIVKNQIQLSITSFWLSNYTQSITYALEPLNTYPLFLTSKDSLNLLSNLSLAYHYDGQLEQAYSARLSSLTIALREEQVLEVAEAYFTIAQIDKDQKEFEKAIENIEKALPIYIQHNQSYDEGFCYDLLGEVYHLMGNYKQALIYKIKSCESGKSNFNDYDKAYCDYTIAQTQLALGNAKAALPLLESALKQWEQQNFPEEYIRTQLVHASWFVQNGNCTKSMSLLDTCLQQAKQLGVSLLLKDVYEKVYQIAEECGNSELGLFGYQHFILFRDSINSIATQKAIAKLGTTHELQQQKQELALLQANQKLQKFNFFGLIGLSIFLICCMGFIVQHWRKQKEHNAILAEKNQKINTQNQSLGSTNFQLKNINGQLKQANQDLERFAYITSHDLRSPLQTVGNFTTLLEKKYKGIVDEEGKMYIDLIVKGVNHMNQLLADILLFSRAKRAPFEPKPVDLNQLINHLLQVLHTAIEEKEATILVDKLPIVLGNNTQLRQVFQNLIVNALKFMPPDEKPIIKIQAKKVGNHFQINIKDNGIGIKPAYQEQVFGIFRRLHNSEEFKGTGLGLAICQTIIQRHQGEIWISSDGKNGTTFHFTLLSPFAIDETYSEANESVAEAMV